VLETSPAVTLLPWLLRLRWAVVVALALVVVAPGLRFLPVSWPLVSLAVVLAATSTALLQWRWLPRAQTASTFPEQSSRVAGALLMFDAVLLTLVLAGSGGAANPFTILYLVLIVLAALVLDTRWTGLLTLWTAACFAVLFIPGINDPHAQCATAGGSAEAYSAHLKGMWLAFAAAAAVLGWVVRELSVTLSAQRTQIAQLRENTLRAAHMAELATLAGGAAHELRTPLATIAVAAHELGRNLASLPGATSLPSAAALQQCVDDAELIEAEVDRCQDVLFAMGPRFSSQASQPTTVLVQAVAARAVAQRMGQVKPLIALDAQCALPASAEIHADEAQLLQALDRLLCNAQDATRAKAADAGAATDAAAHAASPLVTLRIAERVKGKQRWVGFAVEDRGAGMSEDVLSRATTPFFTTKDPGQGMGLGLFLVSAFCLAARGELEVVSRAGQGTRATLWLPLVVKGEPRQAALGLQEQLA
jgi:two-component system, sensor histidine kinase RegB